MPTLVHVVTIWIGGLVVGQAWTTATRPLAPASLTVALIGATLTAAAVWWCHPVRSRARYVAALVLLFLAAVVIARSAALRQTRCRAALLAGLARKEALWLAIDVSASGGGITRGDLWRESATSVCRTRVTVRWQGAPPPAGHRYRVRASGQGTARGLALRNAVVVERGARDALRGIRASAAHTIDAHFRARAPLVRALLIADQDGIPHDLRDRYADAGLVHLLSVSGMHVAIIASALLALASLMRLPVRWAEPAALSAVLLYVLVLGCPPPAVRSAVMLVVVSLSVRWQRPLHDWAPLALGAVVPTVDPLVVMDLGWQLSVGGMAALVAARATRRRARQWAVHHPYPSSWWQRAGRWLITRRALGGWLVTEISTGVIATVITAPLIAWTFGRLSLIAPLSNVLAGPVIGLLQPALFLALLLGPWPAASALVADACQPLMALLDRIADAAAHLPYAAVPIAPTWLTVSAAAVAAALVVRGSAARRATPWMLAAGGALAASLWMPVLHRGSGRLELHVLDVGQGDGLALRTPRGRWVVIDAGPRWDGGDAGARVVVPYLRRRGGAVALFVMSHAHEDHVGGAASVVERYRPAWWWEPAFVTTSPGYQRALVAVRANGVRWRRVHPGDRWALDDVTITVLAPDSTWTAMQTDANETSVVLRVDYGAHRFLLTGDAERDEETWLLGAHPAEALRADVLKLGHHGSRTSTTAPLLDAVRPRVAIASVGLGNRYGHPSPETLSALLARRVPVFRTDRDGHVVVRSDGRRLEVEAANERWIVPPRRAPEPL